MKIGTRLPGFAGEIGFDAYAAWLADNGFEAVDTPTPNRQIARTLEQQGLAYGSCDGRASGLLSDSAATRRASRRR